jgi:hypothetical protein
MSAPGNSQRKWVINDETHNKPPITAGSGIIVRYVSWKKKAALLWCFRFSHQMWLQTMGHFDVWWQKFKIFEVRAKFSLKLRSKFLRSFLGKTSKLAAKIFFFKEKNWKFYSNYRKNLLFFSKMRNFPDSLSPRLKMYRLLSHLPARNGCYYIKTTILLH